MSYDLYFKFRKPESKPDTIAFATFFKQRKHYEVTDKQVVYQNEITGVYFIFDLGGADMEEEPDLLPLSFNLNYFRPHILGLEAEGELKALVEKFDLLVSDSQIDGMGEGEFSSQQFLSGWNKGNEFGYHSIVQQHPNEKLLTLPTTKIEACWRWNFAQAELQQKLGDDVFVPRFMFLNRGGTVITTVVWPDGIPIALPEADIVFFPRKTILPKKFFRSPEDKVLAIWNEVSPLLEQFPLEHGALPYRLLRYTSPPDSVVTHLRGLKPNSEKPEGVSVDKILNAEIVERVRAK
jgi:hypothetical protein